MKAIDYFLKKEYREDKKNPERIFFQDLLFIVSRCVRVVNIGVY